MGPRGLVLLAALGCAATGLGAPKINPGAPAPYTGTIQSSKLYTTSDAPGGIQGRLVETPSEVLGVFAVSREKLKVTQTTKLLQGGTRSEAKYRIAVHFAQLSPDQSFSLQSERIGQFLQLTFTPEQADRAVLDRTAGHRSAGAHNIPL